MAMTQVVRDAYLTTCGHNFCCTCIFTHLGSAQSCPVCLEVRA
jgi:E3 ubiquitin-protein ligase RFWD2